MLDQVTIMSMAMGDGSMTAIAFRAITLIFWVVFAIAVAAGSSAGNLSKEFPWQFRMAARMRTPILMFIVVPLSFLRWVDLTIRLKLRSVFKRAEDAEATHMERVNPIIAQVRLWNEQGRPRPLRTKRANWKAMSTKLSSNKDDCNLIATSHLNFIIGSDLTSEVKTITVEPAATMGEITEYLYPLGYALEINVEMESITIGGVALGFGMEVNSHKSGFFQETVEEYELVNASGELMTVTADSDRELFYALPWSCGALGFLTKLKVRVAPIKKYVHMTYEITNSPAELCNRMTELSESAACHFLEATIFTKDKAVLQMGNFVDKPTGSEASKINGINYWFKPFYYKWLETFLTKDGGEEYIPYKHYCHRFTRSIFWEIEDMIPFANHPIYRTLWGWMGAPEVSLLKLFQGPVIRKASVYAHVVQESIMPVRDLGECIENFDEWYGVYPLLVFPLRVYDRGEHSGFLTPHSRNCHGDPAKGKDGLPWGIWCDLGAYGAPRDVKEGKVWDAKGSVRAMEHWTRDKGGWQACYTDMFCTHREFRQMFNHELMDKVRTRLGATDAFPVPFTKMKPEKGIVDLEDEHAAEKKAGTFIVS